MSHYINILRIKVVANTLEALNEKVVFVGGATISFYPDRPTYEIRPTDDVDVIVEILNYAGRIDLEEKLRSVGFVHDVESNVVCRYRIKGIIVDIMPTSDPSIGFTNKWYEEGHKHAFDYQIDDNCTIKILSAPLFIATKLEAFKSRGKYNGRTSPDFEDIIYVLENRGNIWQEINNISQPVKDYLKDEFLQLLKVPYLSEWIDSHVERGTPPATGRIIEKLKELTSFK